jgi:hypothetical protein
MSRRKRWRANFFDKNGDETRSLTVVALTDEEAEALAEKEADRRKWPSSFKLADVEEIGQ